MTKGLLPNVLESIHKIYVLFTQHLIVWGSKIQAELKEDDEHFANHLQMYVSKTFTKTKKSVLCAEYPSNELKILFIQIENIFFPIYW